MNAPVPPETVWWIDDITSDEATFIWLGSPDAARWSPEEEDEQ